MMAAIKQRAGPGQLRDPAAAQRIRAAAGPGAAAGRSAAARRRRARQFPERRLSRARCDFYVEHVRARLRAGDDQQPNLQRLERVRPRVISRSTSRARGTSASSSAACRRASQDDWMTAPLPGPTDPALDRRRIEPGRVPRSQAQGRGLAADRISFAARRAAPLPRADRRPAAAAQRVERTRALADDVYARAFREQLERVQADAARCPSGSASPTRCGSSPSAWCTASSAVEQARRELDARADAHPRKAPLDARARRTRRESAMSAPRWWFVAPALLVIGVFFLRAGARRARAEPHRFRHLRAGRPAQSALRRARATTSELLRDAAVLAGARQHALFRRRRRAAVDRAPRSARRCCSHSRLARFKGVLSHRAVRAGGDDAGRGRGDLALPASTRATGCINYALGGTRHRADRLARRSALGDAGDHPVRGVEELRLQHDHPARRPAEHSARSCTKRRASTARRLRSSSATSRCRSSRRSLLLVSILTIAGYFQLFAEPYVMTQGGPLQSTVSVLYFMYEQGFKWWNLGSRVGGRVPAVPADLRGDRAAAARGPAQVERA